MEDENAKKRDNFYEKTLAGYDRVIALNPYSVLAYCTRAFIKHTLGDNKGALEDYFKAIELNANIPSVYLVVRKGRRLTLLREGETI